MNMSMHDMDNLNLYMELSSKLDPFMNDDMKDLWDSDLDQHDLGEALRATEDPSDWLIGGNGRSNSHVVLHDRLMTDALLGNAPIKAEHSYCTTHGSSESLDAIDVDDDSSQDRTCKLTFDEVRCDRTGNIEMISIKDDMMSVKEEPMSDQEYVETSSCPPSPCSVPDLPTHYSKIQKTGYDKPTTVVLTSRAFLNQSHKIILPNFGIKMEGTGFTLPPTPPSSTSSDSEGGNISPHHRSSPTRRLFLSSSSSSSSSSVNGGGTTSSRQPIQTPLISCQPKGSTGALVLTEEEKRTLLAEGYPIPTRLPLTKAEEKSLKKIRRKIKNKISAQESRRKKKEYMDSLERKVEILVSENSEYKKKILNLEESNGSLVQQLQKLQKLIGVQATQLIDSTDEIQID